MNKKSFDIMPAVRQHVAQYHGRMRLLARETGISYTLISKISQGRENILVSTAQRLLDHAASESFDNNKDQVA